MTKWKLKGEVSGLGAQLFRRNFFFQFQKDWKWKCRKYGKCFIYLFIFSYHHFFNVKLFLIVSFSQVAYFGMKIVTLWNSIISLSHKIKHIFYDFVTWCFDEFTINEVRKPLNHQLCRHNRIHLCSLGMSRSSFAYFSPFLNHKAAHLQPPPEESFF